LEWRDADRLDSAIARLKRPARIAPHTLDQHVFAQSILRVVEAVLELFEKRDVGARSRLDIAPDPAVADLPPRVLPSAAPQRRDDPRRRVHRAVRVDESALELRGPHQAWEMRHVMTVAVRPAPEDAAPPRDDRLIPCTLLGKVAPDGPEIGARQVALDDERDRSSDRLERVGVGAQHERAQDVEPVPL